MNLNRCLLDEQELAVPCDGCNWLREGVAASATPYNTPAYNLKYYTSITRINILYVHYTNQYIIRLLHEHHDTNIPTNTCLYNSKFWMNRKNE